MNQRKRPWNELLVWSRAALTFVTGAHLGALETGHHGVHKMRTLEGAC